MSLDRTMEEKTVSRWLDLLDEMNLAIKRAQYVLDRLDKEMRVRLNEDWTIKK